MTLHWLIAIAIISMLIVGKYMHGLPNSDPNKFALYQLHKSTGLTVLALSVASHRVAPCERGAVAARAHAAVATVGGERDSSGFYVLIIAIPLSGWAVASTSSSGVPTLWFGLFEVPNLPGLPVGERGKTPMNSPRRCTNCSGI